MIKNGTSLIARVLKRGRSALNGMGYDLHPIDSHCWSDQKALLGDREGLVVLDVGANCGQAACRYRGLFPNARIYCFEPQAELCRQMEDRFKDDPGITVYSCAVGAKEEIADFYVNAKRATSSLLPCDSDHLSPSYLALLRNEEVRPVKVTTLDSFASSKNLAHVDLLKMDIQGAECEALIGAKHLLSECRFDLIYSEVSFVPLYSNQALFGDLASYLAQWNYKLHLLYNQSINGISGKPLQADALFVSPQLQESSRERLRTTWTK
jgi:FkbM family methyltransferase